MKSGESRDEKLSDGGVAIVNKFLDKLICHKVAFFNDYAFIDELGVVCMTHPT